MVCLQGKVRADLTDPVRGVLSTWGQRRGCRSGSTEDREKNRVEELVELHVDRGGSAEDLRTLRRLGLPGKSMSRVD